MRPAKDERPRVGLERRYSHTPSQLRFSLLSTWLGHYAKV